MEVLEEEVEEAGKACVNVRIVRKVSMITKTSVLRMVEVKVEAGMAMVRPMEQ